MRQGKRFGLSAMQKSELWRRWKAGQSLHEIGRAFGKSHSSIRCVVSLHGGFVPAVRRRSLLALTLPEREDISRGIACGSSIRKIAQHLDRAVSTVSREVARHGGRSEYRANEAVSAFTRTYNIASEFPSYRESAQGKLCALLIFQGRTQPDKIK